MNLPQPLPKSVTYFARRLAMLNFDIRRTTRKCAETDRAFSPGEEFISALLEENGEMVRRDYSLANWKSPPENCVGWWKGRIPELATGKVYWAPNDVLLNYFQKINELPGQEQTAFVMALLLVQKRILRMQDSDNESVIQLFHSKTRTEYEVPVFELSSEQKSAIQNELGLQLFTDRAPDSESVGEDSGDNGGDEPNE